MEGDIPLLMLSCLSTLVFGFSKCVVTGGCIYWSGEDGADSMSYVWMDW